MYCVLWGACEANANLLQWWAGPAFTAVGRSVPAQKERQQGSCIQSVSILVTALLVLSEHGGGCRGGSWGQAGTAPSLWMLLQ